MTPAFARPAFVLPALVFAAFAPSQAAFAAEGKGAAGAKDHKEHGSHRAHGGHGNGKHKAHKAHEHGAAVLNIAVERNKAQVEFEAPADSIYGFEHEAKTDADRKKRDDAIAKLGAEMPKMVVLGAQANCTWTTSKMEPFVTHGDKPGAGKAEHGEVHATFEVTCPAPLAGTKVTFAFAKAFPKIGRVKVQALSGEKQSGANVKKDKGSVDL